MIEIMLFFESFGNILKLSAVRKVLETLLFLALFSQRKVSEDGRITPINKTLKKLLDLYKRTVFLCSQQTPEMVFVFYSGLL